MECVYDQKCSIYLISELVHVLFQPRTVGSHFADPDKGVELQVLLGQAGGFLEKSVTD